jgi:hypothetical protein
MVHRRVSAVQPRIVLPLLLLALLCLKFTLNASFNLRASKQKYHG